MWQNNKSKCKTKFFQNKDEAKIFLANLFASINTEQEYNIYIHQINGYYCDMKNIHGTQAIKHRVSSIIRHGFSIRKYSALSGTAMLIGNTNEPNLDKIMNYEYYQQQDCVALCIIAIPKYININGTQVEYSSYQGKDSWHFPNELTDEYKRVSNYKPEVHHYKCCLFDSIKQYNDLPSCYMLGILQIETKENKYNFIQTQAHLSNLGKEEKNLHNDFVSNLIKKLYEKYNTIETKKIIVNSYMEHQKYYDDLSSFEI